MVPEKQISENIKNDENKMDKKMNDHSNDKNKKPEPKNMNAVLDAKPVRIRFIKDGDLIYISHLDLNRTMQRIIVRAGIPIWYSEGFNPQPKLVFSSPLSVGCAGECEYMDIKLVKDMDYDEVMRRLNEASPEGLRFTDVYSPDTKFTQIAFAEYEIVISDASDKNGMAEKINDMFTHPVILMKRSKSGDKETDISGFIKKISALVEDDLIKISCVLSADSANYLNPEYIVTALKNKFALLSGDLVKEWYTVKRIRLIKSDGETTFR